MASVVRRRLSQYGVAVLTAGLATWLVWQFQSPRNLPAILFFGAVFASAWIGGLGPGLVTTFLSVLALGFFLLPDGHLFGLPQAGNLMSLLVFTLFAVLISYLTENRRRAEQAARAAYEAENQARRAAEAEIRKREELEEQLKLQAADLERADRIKDDFLATLAHELRNPLAPIRNALHLLKVTSSVGPDHQWARDVIDRQVRQMVRLVDDLLDVSRIARGKLQVCKAPVQIAVVVQRAVEVSRPWIEQRRHQLAVALPPEPLWLDADEARLTQAVANLLNNAAKYTEDGGQIAVTVQREGSEAVLRVRDTGVGIPPEMLPRIFERFIQVDRTLHRAQGGLGIGLTLVRTLVEAHGGQVEARSAGPGKGSEFMVRLPLRDPQGAGRITPIRLQKKGRTLRVLLVAGSSTAENLGEMLRAGGHEICVAPDEETALVMLPEFRPDLVLCEFHVPGIDGRELAHRIRLLSGFEKVILVAMTAAGREDDRRLAAEIGFDHQLVKPVDPLHLKAILVSRASYLPAQTISR